MIATLIAALVLATSPVIPLPEAELYPTGDAVGTWDHIFTHDELAEARAAGGLTAELRQLIQQRLNPPAPVVVASSGGGTAPKSTSPPPRGSDVIDWSGYVAPYDWNDATALRVIWCESRNDRLAVNPSSGASGGWQFMPFWHSQVDPFDPADATRFAYVLWLDGGGSFSGHWYPSQHCWG